MGTYARVTLLVLTIAAAIVISPISSVSGQENPNQYFESLTMVLLYDEDHDGFSEGVGYGRPVDVYRGGEHFANGQTNALSSVTFLLPFGKYEVIGFAGFSETPFYYWECRATILFDEPGQLELIRCKETGIHKILLPLLGL